MDSVQAKQYGTMLADPPWPERGGGKSKRGADAHYPVMHVPDILAYLQKVPMLPDAHCYIWVTNNFLEAGLWVMGKLGFRYVTNIVWVKDSQGLGQYYRGQHELCLFGVRGRPGYKNSVNDHRAVATESTVIFGKKGKHSVKPLIQVRVEKVSPGPFIEAFARTHLEGWDVIGNQAPDAIQMRLGGAECRGI